MSDIKKTTIGGQALIEGIMMVGPRRTSIAVRKGDGTIHVEEIKQSERVTFFEKVPFVRGCIRFWKMLVTGTGALMKSAELSEEGAPDVVDETKKEKKKSALDDYLEKHYDLMVIFSAILGILISIGIFILLPNLMLKDYTRVEKRWHPSSRKNPAYSQKSNAYASLSLVLPFKSYLNCPTGKKLFVNKVSASAFSGH